LSFFSLAGGRTAAHWTMLQSFSLCPALLTSKNDTADTRWKQYCSDQLRIDVHTREREREREREGGQKYLDTWQQNGVVMNYIYSVEERFSCTDNLPCAD
jgi:hypothetical protein